MMMTFTNSSKPKSQVRHAAVWIVSSWVVVTVVGLTIAGVTTGSGAGPVDRRATPLNQHGTLAGLGPARPLLGGERITPAHSSSLVGFNVPVPNTSIANSGNLTATWAVASRRQVALVFDRGKLDVVFKPAIYKDAASEYRTFICENGGATIGRVNGLPALVIEPRTDYYHTNPAWIEFDLKGVNVDVFSHDYSPRQLLAVADSIAPPASTQTQSPPSDRCTSGKSQTP
jgi:hypothetical protein